MQRRIFEANWIASSAFIIAWYSRRVAIHVNQSLDRFKCVVAEVCLSLMKRKSLLVSNQRLLVKLALKLKI
jgi:hypothetical protein